MQNLKIGAPFLELIIGCMKSGKSTAAKQIAEKYSRYVQTIVVNSAQDSRHSDDFITTHSGSTIPCVKVLQIHTLEDMELFQNADLIIIDEAQFFGSLSVFVTKWWGKKSFVVSSLNGDFKQKSFGEVHALLSLATNVTMLSALCEKCCDGTPAHFTIAAEGKTNGEQVDVDDIGGNKFMSVCIKHVNKTSEPTEEQIYCD